MITKFPSSGIFFTADSHWNHSKILDFCKRPFKDITEHDEKLIENWNSVVSPDDTVFHLGDFCFGSAQKIKEVRKRLNGHIYLIKGNHDRKNMQESTFSLFEDAVEQATILIDGRTVYLNHFPFLCFAHSNIETYGKDYAIQLFGHIHSGPNSTSQDTSRSAILYPTQYDVGVDNNNYFPVSWKEINDLITLRVNDTLTEIKYAKKLKKELSFKSSSFDYYDDENVTVTEVYSFKNHLFCILDIGLDVSILDLPENIQKEIYTYLDSIS